MTTTIAGPSITHTPTTLTGYRAAAEGNSVFHKSSITGQIVAVTRRGADLRSGELEALFTGETAATLFFNDLRTGMPFYLSDTDRASVAMPFALAGRVEIELENETRDLWLVRFEFQELSS